MNAPLRLVERTGTAQRSATGPSQGTMQHVSLYDDDRQRSEYMASIIAAYLSQEGVATSGWHQYTTSNQSLSHSIQAILEEIGRLSDGWMGEESVAPKATVVRDVQLLAPMLPLGTRTPDVEIDPSDGEVKLAWRSNSEAKSIAISMMGDGRARVIQASLSDRVLNPMVEVTLSPSMPREGGRTLHLLEHCDLFLRA